MYSDIVDFIRNLYKTESFIPLHEPVFNGNEKKYLNACIDSTFVSSVGKFVSDFEKIVAKYTGSKFAVAVVNGTAALHAALLMADVSEGDEVITQPLTFVATVNAISYCRAKPVFLDVDRETLGLSADALKSFLEENTFIRDNVCINKYSGNKIKACVPMHTFGHPCKIDEIKIICDQNQITLIEDAAESIGSYYDGKHTGTFGTMGVLSFNGNKTITTGGGGMILTNDQTIAEKVRHITTTAKKSHPWEFDHDEIGYNYRLTNLAAALGCAQMEQLPHIINAKRKIADIYNDFFKSGPLKFVKEPENAKSNYWLNAILLPNKKERDKFLAFSNDQNVMTRPVWKLMNKLKMFKNCIAGDLYNALWLEERIVNLPSSPKI